MSRQLLLSLTALGAVLLTALLAQGQDGTKPSRPPARDPFKTPPAIKRAAADAPSAERPAAERAGPSLRGVLTLRGKTPGALLRLGGETFVVRAGDVVTAGGRTFTVKAIGAAGVTLTHGSDGQPLRLTIR